MNLWLCVAGQTERYQRDSQPSAGVRMKPSSAAEGLDLHKLLLCYVMNAHPLECTSCCFPQAATYWFSSSYRKSYRNQMLLSVFLQSLLSKYICLKNLNKNLFWLLNLETMQAGSSMKRISLS